MLLKQIASDRDRDRVPCFQAFGARYVGAIPTVCQHFDPVMLVTAQIAYVRVTDMTSGSRSQSLSRAAIGCMEHLIFFFYLYLF